MTPSTPLFFAQDDAPGAGPDQVQDLEARVAHRREALKTEASPSAKGRLHLEVALLLERLGEERADEALEEVRQALALLSEQGAPLEQAEARLALGRMLLRRATHHAEPEIVPSVRRQIEGAAYHLEWAHRGLGGAGKAASKLAAARLGSVALALLGQHERAYELLERACAEVEGDTLVRAKLYLAEHALRDPDPARCAQGEAILASYFARGDDVPDDTKTIVMHILAMAAVHLPDALQEGARAWLERQPSAPRAVVIGLRARVHEDNPDLVLPPEDRAALAATMEDEAAPVARRAEAASVFLWALPRTEHVLAGRAMTLLESWLDARDIHPLQRDVYRHDLAVAMRQRGEGDASLLERAARLLEGVFARFAQGPSGPIVAGNLAEVLFQLLAIRAVVSSPALLSLVERIDLLARCLPHEQARELQLGCADALLRCGSLSHSSCVEAAGALIGEMLAHAPDDADAHRLRYLHAWIRHEQGLLDGKKLVRILELARAHGDVQAIEPMEEAYRNVARCLADGGTLHGAELEHVIAVLPMRPDAAERVLGEIERRLGVAAVHADQRCDLLERAIEVAMMPATGDDEQIGARVAGLFTMCLPYLAPAKLRQFGSLARGPVGEAVRASLTAAGIPEDAHDDPMAARAEQRIIELHREGIELMDKGQRRALESDTTAARRLFERAMHTLDQACAQARGAIAARRVLIHISAGNARRHLARFDKARCGKLLAESEALYREAWPWTEGQTHLRAQLAKVRADGLIQRYSGRQWAEAMALYQVALAARSGGFTRMETLWSMAEAELACPDRQRSANVTAALGRLDESLDMAKGDAHQRKLVARRLLSLMQEAAADRSVDPKEIRRIAERVAAAVPDLADEAVLAAMGIGFGSIQPGVNGGLPPELQTAISSGFMRAFSETTEAISAPLSVRSAPTEMREAVQALIAQGKIKDNDRRHDVVGAWAATERSRHGSPGESPERGAGRLVGRAMVLAHLVLLGEDALAELHGAVQEAKVAIRRVKNPGLRGFALAELSKVFQHDGSRCRDFVRGAQMLEEALSLYPSDWQRLRAESLCNLARATRFREDLSSGEAIERALPLYALAIELNKKLGRAEGLMIALQNLSEALAAREDRPRVVAEREAMATLRAALLVARALGDEPFGEQAGNLAYVLTRYAMAIGVSTEAGERCLEEAGALFESARRLVRKPGAVQAIDINYLTFLGALHASNPDRTRIRAALRESVSSIDPRAKPFFWAMAAHNLAEELFDHSQGPEDLRAALGLYRKALSLRPHDAESRYHWETAVRLGELLAKIHSRRHSLDLASFELTADEARAQATACLRSAMHAGRALGSGGSLVHAARILGLLAADVDPGEMPDLDIAGEALAPLEEVLALVPEDRGVGQVESEVATAIAGALAHHHARSARGSTKTTTGAIALHGETAQEVLQWMLRARGGQHRRLRARLARPEGVSPEVWTRWRISLRRQGNWDERRAAAKAVQRECPSFLTEKPTLDNTAAWIEQSRSAAAMLLETHTGWLLGVLSKGEGERPVRASVVLLPGATPKTNLPDLLRTLRAPATAPGRIDEAHVALEGLAQWLRSYLLPDLRAQIPAETKALLWSPHGVAAGLPLGMVWDELSSIWTTPCLTLPPRRPAAEKPDSALLVLADPTDADGDTVPGGPAAIASMAQTLSSQIERMAVLLGRGHDVGRGVINADVPGLLPDTAPTPDEVRRRMADHALIVVLAHGRYTEDAPEKSSLALLQEGEVAPLSAEMLAEEPDLLHGAVVVLLSCETGTAGELSAAPAGLAGVLLAAGASAVVAPLWPVLVRDGLGVGREVVKLIGAGTELGEAIQSTCRKLRMSGAGKDIEALYGALPFVVWTG